MSRTDLLEMNNRIEKAFESLAKHNYGDVRQNLNAVRDSLSSLASKMFKEGLIE